MGARLQPAGRLLALRRLRLRHAATRASCACVTRLPNSSSAAAKCSAITITETALNEAAALVEEAMK